MLIRWQALEQGDGIQRVKSAIHKLELAGFALVFVVVLGIVYGLHPVLIALAALIAGWIIAERNALRTRMDQWPFLKRYIDWTRVHEDLSNQERKV
jgi:hypothetical protein